MRSLFLAVLVLGLWVGEARALCSNDAPGPGAGQTCAALSQGYSWTGTWTGGVNTRTADTNAYTANDVIGTNTSAGGAVMTLTPTVAPFGTLGGEVLITSATLEIDDTAVISGETSYNLYIYSSAPGSNLADNAAFDIPSGDRAVLLGKISLGSPVDEGSTLYVQSDGINKQITVPAGDVLSAYLVTVGGYTPPSARPYKVRIKGGGL